MHSLQTRRATWTWLTIAVLVALPAGADDANPSVAAIGAATQSATLAPGEIRIEAVQRGDLPGLRARFAVGAETERVWAALIDYQHFTQIFPDIDRLEVIQEDSAGATVEFWIDAVLTHYHYVLRREYDAPPHRLHWTRVSGDLKRIEGSWTIEAGAEPGESVLTYEMYVKTGIFTPMSIVRWLGPRKAREMAQNLRTWLAVAHQAHSPPAVPVASTQKGDGPAAEGAQ